MQLFDDRWNDVKVVEKPFVVKITRETDWKLFRRAHYFWEKNRFRKIFIKKPCSKLNKRKKQQQEESKRSFLSRYFWRLCWDIFENFKTTNSNVFLVIERSDDKFSQINVFSLIRYRFGGTAPFSACFDRINCRCYEPGHKIFYFR